MTTLELLTRLRKRDVRLWLDGERLRFRAPEGALTDELRREIGARKAEVVEFLRQADDAVGSDAPAITRVARDGELPLSFAQLRLWFLDRFEPGSPAYNIPQALRFLGPLRLDALERSLTEIVRRHEVLRTTLVSSGDEPRQRIHPPTSQPLPRVDLAALPGEVRETEALRLTSEEASAPFDLVRGPVLRTRLLALAGEDHVLLVTIHHVAADGWSLGILVRELRTLYEAYSDDPTASSPLPELEVQYADFAAWQRRWLSGSELERQIAFWKSQLEGAPPVLELPADRPAPARRSYHGGKVLVRVPKAPSEALEGLARGANASLFMVLLALFEVLLTRYSGQEDVVVGSPIANRNRAETEDLIGFFVNTLALRLRGHRGTSFRGLLEQARETTLGCYAHQDLPFEKLVEEIDPERDLSRHPVFQVMLALQNAPAEGLDLPGLRLRPMGGERRSAKFDWNVSLWESGRGLRGWLEYSSDLFDRPTAERAARHFAALAMAAARDPDHRAFELPLLAPCERQQLLREWNPTVRTELDPTPVHERLETQAARTPERVAAVFEGRSMSYGELDRRSNQLAHRLQALGVGPEVTVAIRMERSLRMAVAVVGVLKAGGCYLPMDPNYPRERLAYMLEDSGARVILADVFVGQAPPADSDGHRPSAGESAGGACPTPDDKSDVFVRLDDGWRELGEQSCEPPGVPLSRDNLLYRIYTSGSTGRPKGIGLSHLALANLVEWHLRTLANASRTLQLASLGFDASFHEMFAAWTSGGTLFLVPEAMRQDAEGLFRFLVRERIEKAVFPVVLLRELAEVAAGQEALPYCLGEILVTGEQPQVTPALASFAGAVAGCSLHNHYGPSEAHVVTSYTMTGPHRSWPARPPAGRPIDNGTVWVVDRWGSLAPPGVPGELHLGGVTLARGYLGRPALTAEKFVPDPFADGGRLYRTGDLCRILADGNVEYLGRFDDQVKIRGHRVELGEVESALSRHPEIRGCAVVTARDAAGYTTLVAFFVPEAEPLPSERLRRFLGERLPDYMVPSHFTALDALPLSPNKKIDRAALVRKGLPAPRTAEDAFAEPRTLVEQGLSEIWGEVLGVPRVGAADNFFHLGGHSLNATQAVSRIRRLFGVELPVRRLFESPVLAALARDVETALGSGTAASSAPLLTVRPRRGERPRFPLSFAQERLWFLEQLLPGSPIHHLPAVLRVHGRLDAAALGRAFTEITRRHESLRTTFTSAAGRPWQVVEPPPEVALPLVDLSRLDEPERRATVRARISEEARRPFDLARGPLSRAGLLRLGDEDHVLVFVVHHIVSDGWSQGILIRELSAFYVASADGAAPTLPELPVQYADFAVWQREWLSGEVLEAELTFWRQKLDGMPPVLELGTDRPRPRVATHEGASLAAVLPPELTQAVKAFGGRHGATLFMTLMAAYQALLYRHTGQADFGVGTPIAGRGRTEIEGLIGFFVNTQVIRAELRRGDGFAELAARTRERTLAALAHQDLPFEKLVAELEPERDTGHSPLYQVMFVLQNTPRGDLELPGLRFSRMEGGSAAARSDLLLALSEQEQRLAGHFEYKSGLFDRSTVVRLRRHFLALLEAALETPERLLEELAFLAPAERHQLALEWNDGWTEERPAITLHQLFEARAAEAPDSVALSFEPPGAVAEALTYGELNARANRLAHHLRSLGVGPEVVVGLSAERSPQLVVGLLGILKTGGAYLPLDPLYPAERLAFMLDDAQGDTEPRVVVTTEGVHSVHSAHSVHLGSAELASLSSENPEASSGDISLVPLRGNLAYVIYTSGSTGRPKGVLVEHGHVVRLFEVMGRILPETGSRLAARNPPLPPLFQRGGSDASLRFGLPSEAKRGVSFPPLKKGGSRGDFSPPGESVWTLFHSYAFDFSVWELFGALCHGGRLVVVPHETSRSPKDFLDLLVRQRVTALNQTPSAFRQLSAAVARSGRAAELSLSWVVFGGEALEPESLAPWYELFGDGGPRLVNMYGITETTVHVTWHPLSRAGVRIGRPLPDLGVWLLDRDHRPVPVGAAGEIHVGGAGVARGYLARPALTAERFVPHPFAVRGGERLYASGDLARLRASGELEYLGRADHQVKIRGFRVEPGEVEAAVKRCPGVGEAVVFIDGASASDRRLIACLVPEKGTDVSIDDVRRLLREQLPEHMVPAAWAVVPQLPLTANGKVDRAALGRLAKSGAGTAEEGLRPRDEAETEIAGIWRQLLGLEEVGVHDNFFDLGGHSLLLVELQSRLGEAFGREVAILDLFRHTTVSAQAELFRGGRAALSGATGIRRAEPRVRPAFVPSSGIAVVGMAGRFPGAASVDELWENLADGVESVTFFSDEELAAAGVGPELVANPSYVKAQGRIEDAELFDAGLFGIPPREAQVLDPQQRLFLECAWEVLEDAGHDPRTFAGPIGVFAGVNASRYWMKLFADPDLMSTVGTFQASLGNDKDFLPTRVSYKLGLTGPSVNVQTACSTALVAVHLGCRSLLAGECDMVLAGGVSLAGTEKSGYLYEPDGILSPDGHCRSFDARAQGTVTGSGAGVVALRRLEDALADGDVIRAVIKGSAVNNDGFSKAGFTAPSIEGQSRVIAEALAAAGIEPADVGLVEAHGTATALGDPIEVAALKEVFGGEAGETCALGSVKSNFGHLGSAAGAAGLIKAVLALEHGRVPPSLHFEKPNPEAGIEESPFFVPTRLVAWPEKDGPRRAGVSSFGLGGTNAHLVVEQAPAAGESSASRTWQLLVASAHTETALDEVSGRVADHCRRHAGESLADVAFTLQTGRRRLRHRRFAVCRDPADAAEIFGGRDPRRIFGALEERTGRGVAFLFPGLGDHYAGMARGLYDGEPAFREEVDRASEILRPILGESLRDVLFPEGVESADRDGAVPRLDLRRLAGRGEADAASGPLDRIELAHPAIFVIEVALARLWKEWGVEPEAMIGYSLGEYTAAHLAGVFSLEDALALVAERARLAATLPEGAMLAVPLSEAETRELLGPELALAASNSPQVSVVSGPAAAVAALEEELDRRELVSQRLRSRHAFHSRMMEPVASQLADRLRRTRLRPPGLPYLSNVTGTWITAEEATDPEYWARHLCETVRFDAGLAELGGESQPSRVLLEVGPGRALATFARQHPDRRADQLALPSLRDEHEQSSDVAFSLNTLGRLWLAGVDVDWRGFYRHEKRRRVRLPTYPFERERFGVEARPSPGAKAARSADRPKPDPADWFYTPSWKLSAVPEIGDGELERSTWLLFTDGRGVGSRLAERLGREGQDVVTVGLEDLDPDHAEDYEALIRKLHDEERLPRHVVHLWGLEEAPAPGPEAFEACQRLGLYSVLYLARALAGHSASGDVDLAVVTEGRLRVEAGDRVVAEKGTLGGVLKVLPQEYRNVRCRGFDVAVHEADGPELDELAGNLFADLADGDATDLTVAYRRGLRWVERFDALGLPAPKELRPGLRHRGVYLVTGGFGKVGRIVTRYLAETAGARLALVGRSSLPPREEWDTRLAAADAASARILQVRELEAAGAEVLALSADAADRDQMASAVAAVRERFGALHGVIHLAGATTGDVLLVPVEKTGPEECRKHFLPKARALYVLEEVLAGHDLDFCMLFSSLSTVLGGLGFAAYASANAFMDAFAEAKSSAPTPWLAVAWDGWRGTEKPSDGGTLSMGPSQGADAFHRVLAVRAAPRIVVSLADLEARLDRWVRFTSAEASPRPVETAYTRPHLATPYVAPESDLERSIAEIWSELLGIGEIGVHDNFFELGGDSLLATQVVSRLRRVVQVEMPLQEFLNRPTVAQSAEHASRHGEETKQELKTIEELLSRVQGMSEEELEAALGEN